MLEKLLSSRLGSNLYPDVFYILHDFLKNGCNESKKSQWLCAYLLVYFNLSPIGTCILIHFAELNTPGVLTMLTVTNVKSDIRQFLDVKE